jgi:hypothetical protein
MFSIQHHTETDTRPTNLSSSPLPQSAALYSFEMQVDTERAMCRSTAPISQLGVDETDESEQVYKYAVEGLQKANAVLQQHHDAMKAQHKSDPFPKHNPLDILTKDSVLAPMGSTRVASLPSCLPAASYRRTEEFESVKESRRVLQRRWLIRDLAYRAGGGCQDAIVAFEKLNAHYMLKARHQSHKDIPDLILNFDGTHISANQLCNIERTG